MDKCTHEVRKQYWKNIINQCLQRPEGMTVKQWLDENRICVSSATGHESCRTRRKWISSRYSHTDRIHTHWCCKHRIGFII